MIDDRFLQTLSKNTTAPYVMRQRFDLWFQALREAVDDYEKTIEEADKVISLQRKTTACILCPQHISSPEDAFLIQEGDKEGLTHLFCAHSRLREPF